MPVEDNARRTTLNVEQTAVMVRFDFLIIIRLLSLASPFRFDNSWKRLSFLPAVRRFSLHLTRLPRPTAGDV